MLASLIAFVAYFPAPATTHLPTQSAQQIFKFPSVVYIWDIYACTVHRITKILISLYNLFSIFCSHSFFVVRCFLLTLLPLHLFPFPSLSISYCYCCCFCSAFGCFVWFLCLLVARPGTCHGRGRGSCGRCVVVVAVAAVVVIVILLLFIVTQTNITLLQPHRDMANTHTDSLPGGGRK